MTDNMRESIYITCAVRNEITLNPTRTKKSNMGYACFIFLELTRETEARLKLNLKGGQILSTQREKSLIS